MGEFTGKAGSQTENKSYTNTLNSAMELKIVYRLVSLILDTLSKKYLNKNKIK